MAPGLTARDALTMHAWRRYCERVPGARQATFDEACAALLTLERLKAIEQGVQHIIVPAERFVIVCKDQRVVTVLSLRQYLARHRGQVRSKRPRAWRGRRERAEAIR